MATTDMPRTADAPSWWAASAPFVSVGVACVLAGGLLSAIVATHPTEGGSWAAAYLVLIGGVAQIALGWGQARLPAEVPGRRTLVLEFIAWNLGNAGVIAGQLLGVQAILVIGGVLLIVALAFFLRALRTAGTMSGWLVRLLWAYRAVIVIVLVSVPVGLIISFLKS